MVSVREIVRRPAVRGAYHTLVGTGLRQDLSRAVRMLGERIVYSRMIPLGPNGYGIDPARITRANPHILFSQALGPNGGDAAAPSAPASSTPAPTPSPIPTASKFEASFKKAKRL